MGKNHRVALSSALSGTVATKKENRATPTNVVANDMRRVRSILEAFAFVRAATCIISGTIGEDRPGYNKELVPKRGFLVVVR